MPWKKTGTTGAWTRSARRTTFSVQSGSEIPKRPGRNEATSPAGNIANKPPPRKNCTLSRRGLRFSGADGVGTTEGIDGNRKFAQLRNARDQCIRQDPKILALSGKNRAENHSIEQAEGDGSPR